ncbi:MAG: response regulator transcription factor [Dehalococcoidia bacterium]|nr:response regulator transcription factor [Dehalococcoidia bacterium]
MLEAEVSEVDVAAEDFDAALRPSPSAVVVVLQNTEELRTLPSRIKAIAHSPLLAIVDSGLLNLVLPRTGVDDFALIGAPGAEIRARVRRLADLNPDSGDIIKRGDLSIDTANCEVSLGGHLIELTFKEYELLKFLAANPGRVHSRDVLLDRVWGYDYYGGDRTVDVHVRRLRSKIENTSHTFIDTVRNVGYRFHKDV